MEPKGPIGMTLSIEDIDLQSNTYTHATDTVLVDLFVGTEQLS